MCPRRHRARLTQDWRKWRRPQPDTRTRARDDGAGGIRTTRYPSRTSTTHRIAEQIDFQLSVVAGAVRASLRIHSCDGS